MNIKNLLAIISVLIFVIGCGSTPKAPAPVKKQVVEEEPPTRIKRQYIVTDAYPERIPGWARRALRKWLKRNRQDSNEYKYFVHIGSEYGNKDKACNESEARVTATISEKVRTFISKSYSSFMEGDSRIDKNDPNKDIQIKSFQAEQLKAGVKMMITGIDKGEDSYWEERHYRKSKGAAKDFYAYKCDVLAKIKKETLQIQIDKWLKKQIDRHFKNKEQRKMAREGLKDVAKAFADSQ